ncbi:endonuclease V [Methanobacterium sp.]|jgi:deoxyinosine 3'endonuclease (endonuclease V)|uniref:endonuclease V n=1 Tax=Methanobacterium sp. TaxID=2164 RepID=UPI0031584DAB
MCSYNFNQKLAEIQYSLSKKIIEQDSFGNLQTVAGADVSFQKDNFAVAAAVVIDLDNLKIIDAKTLEVELLFPYISGFLGFREADAVISVLRKLNSHFDVLMVNGHGIMHPRGFGLASHVGLLMDTPTVGVAKKLIKGNYKYTDGNSLKTVEFMDKPVGACDKQKCISVGHKLSLKTAVDIVLKTSIFKMPEPVRQAHILATNTMKGKIK